MAMSSFPMRRVLLLGGTGFIGSHVLAALRRNKDVRLMMLGHHNVDYRALEDVDLVVDSLSHFDLSWIETFRPDTIIPSRAAPGRRTPGKVPLGAEGPPRKSAPDHVAQREG